MIKNCFNYVGNKDRVMPAIEDNIDKTKSTLVDLFCGSATVGLNMSMYFKRVILNDACWQMMETLKAFKDLSSEDLVAKVQTVIDKYELSKTNKEGYLALREDYNRNNTTPQTFDPIMFYCLATHSFNYNIHLNSKDEFSVPSGAGRCYLSPQLMQKLKNFHSVLRNNQDKFSFRIANFTNAVKANDLVISDTTFYVDPPYLSSDSSYGRIHYLGRWNEDNERELYKQLDYINDKGGTFLLSNVMENNGNANRILSNWADKYKVVDVNTSYDNCNYQRKNAGKTKEVLVRNY